MTEEKVTSHFKQKARKITNLLHFFGKLRASSCVLSVVMGGYCINPKLMGGYGWLLVTDDYWVVMGDSCF